MELFDGRYDIVSKRGEGGNATVYLAADGRSGERVALKWLHPEHRGDEVSLDLFEREFQAMRSVDVCGVPRVFDRGLCEGTPYFTMEYVEGTELTPILDGNPPWTEAARLVTRLAYLVDRVHRCGVVHRDVTPGNVLVGGDGTLWLVDFGIATPLGVRLPDYEQEFLMGTAAFIAPERLVGGTGVGTPGQDIFSLGVMLYHVLTGEIPFDGFTHTEILKRIRFDRARPFERDVEGRRLPRSIRDVALRALDRNPALRFPSARRMGHAIRAAVELAERRRHAGEEASEAA